VVWLVLPRSIICVFIDLFEESCRITSSFDVIIIIFVCRAIPSQVTIVSILTKKKKKGEGKVGRKQAFFFKRERRRERKQNTDI
jgi:hypothetical protein